MCVCIPIRFQRPFPMVTSFPNSEMYIYVHRLSLLTKNLKFTGKSTTSTKITGVTIKHIPPRQTVPRVQFDISKRSQTVPRV